MKHFKIDSPLNISNSGKLIDNNIYLLASVDLPAFIRIIDNKFKRITDYIPMHS